MAYNFLDITFDHIKSTRHELHTSSLLLFALAQVSHSLLNLSSQCSSPILSYALLSPVVCYTSYLQCLVVLCRKNRMYVSAPSLWRSSLCSHWWDLPVAFLCEGTWNWKAVAIEMRSDCITAPALTVLTPKSFLIFWLMPSGTSSP